MFKPRDRRVCKRLRRRAPLELGALLSFAISIGAPHLAAAQATANPYADVHYEHDSNVFRVPNSQANLVALGDPTMADNDLKTVIGADGSYLWSEQKLTATIEGRRYVYDHFSELDHNEYLADVALKWKSTSLLDGTVEGRQEQFMAPFTLGNSTQLSIDVDRKVTGGLNLNFNPDWRLESQIYSHNLKSPLQDFPDFVEREVGTQLALLNRSVSNLTYGITIDHISGRFENAPDVGTYNQVDAQLTVNYAVSTLTSLKGAVGYTKRDQVQDSLSAVTGSVGYRRQLTGKTTLTFNLARAVNSYVAAGGSEIDTSATLGLNWQATYLIGVQIQGGYMHSTFVGQFVPGSLTSGRADDMPTGSLNLNYQIFRHAVLKAYAQHQARTSNIDIYRFSDTIYGIEARVSLH